MDFHADWAWNPANSDTDNKEDRYLDLSNFVEDVNKKLKHDLENNIQTLGMTISGLDMSDSIILGMFGLQISTAGVNVTIGVKNTQYASSFNPLSAIVVIVPVLDVTGKITAKVGFTYRYSDYLENGINVQKKDFVGAYSSLDQNKGQEMGSRSNDPPIEVYSDAEGKFVFPNVKDGEYELVFSKEGYGSYKKKFTMKGENQEFRVKLELEGFRNTLMKLIEEQGIFKENQRGTMQKWDDAWFDPCGILCAKIMDFDLDGKEEMLVCDTKPYFGDSRQI